MSPGIRVMPPRSTDTVPWGETSRTFCDSVPQLYRSLTFSTKRITSAGYARAESEPGAVLGMRESGNLVDSQRSSGNNPTRTVTLRGKSIRLSPLEYEVLQVLARAAPQMVSYQDLLEAVWGYGSGDKRNYLKLYIRYLRVKLEEDPASPKLIINERGKGYRLAV